MRKLLALPLILLATQAHALTVEFDDSKLNDFCEQIICKDRLEDGEPVSKQVLAAERILEFYDGNAKENKIRKAVEAARAKAEQEA